jgi:hypothetical protein
MESFSLLNNNETLVDDIISTFNLQITIVLLETIKTFNLNIQGWTFQTPTGLKLPYN